MQSDYTVAVPMAGALTSSLRNFPYSTPTAVADIIDNSITAGAENISITFGWNGPNSYVAICDDGSGMTAQELINAMTIGSIHPEEERAKNDLGRFGLGMKTASFSQCRNVTVYSQIKNNGNKTQSISIARWDLDELRSGEWKLLHYPNNQAELLITELAPKSSGTLLMWQNLDRLVDVREEGKLRADAEADFWRVVRDVERHLSLTFHRFLIPRPGKRALKIYINNRKIAPLDPFLSSNDKLQDLGDEQLSLGNDREKHIKITPYVLPHQRFQAEQDKEDGALIDGWNAHQGFYIYRNNRLLLAGSWMRLWQQEEHYKLARIRVDIPNNLDEEFQIDVVKAQARIPQGLRDDFRRIGKETRSRAMEIYRQKGQVTTKSQKDQTGHIWKKSSVNGLNSYKLDRKHPVIQALSVVQPSLGKELDTVLKIIEETVPVETIWIDKAETPDEMAGPLEGKTLDEMNVLAQATLELYMQMNESTNRSYDDAIKLMRKTEPFIYYQEFMNDFEIFMKDQ